MGAKIPLVFWGASTGFQEIAEVVRRINQHHERYEITAILDDNTDLWGTTVMGIPVVGGLNMAHDYPAAKFVFCVGSLKTRMVRSDILRRVGIPDDRFETLIDPQALVYPDVDVGYGSIIHAGVVIGHNTVLEPFSIITFHAAIGPYSRIGRCAMLTTRVTALTGIEIGACAFIGANSCLAEGVKIGAGAMVGMATVISRNIEAGAVVLGNPARVLYHVPVPEELRQIGTKQA